MAPGDDSPALRSRGLLLLLVIVIAGSSWQFAARLGRAEPSRAAVTPLPRRAETPGRSRAPAFSYREGLGLARIGAPVRVEPAPAGPSSRRPSEPPGGSVSRVPPPMAHEVADRRIGIRTGSLPAGVRPPGAVRRHEPEPAPMAQVAGSSEASGPDGWEATTGEPGARGAAREVAATAVGRSGPDEGEDEDLLDDFDEEDPGEEAGVDDGTFDDEALPEETFDPDGHGTQVVMIGPAVARVGEAVIYSILVENARNLAHAPLRIDFDPEVLQYVEAEEGEFLSTGGKPTRFLAREIAAAGVIEVDLSRVPPSHGADGNGLLCSLRFLAKKTGSSPVGLAGSRLLDPAGTSVSFERNDAGIAIR